MDDIDTDNRIYNDNEIDDEVALFDKVVLQGEDDLFLIHHLLTEAFSGFRTPGQIVLKD